MTNNPTRKRAQTSYGQIEYDTLQCAECTNETVVGDVTHVYTVDSTADVHHASPEDCRAHTVCTGCVKDSYDFGGEVLTHATLQEWYDEHSWLIHLQAINDITFEQREEPTPHGTVDVEIAECSRCEGEWITDELRAVWIPVAGVEDELHAAVRLYCPDCRELYLDAPDQAGVALDSLIDGRKTVAEKRIEERDARETSRDTSTEGSSAKDHLTAAIGWFLVGIILASIFGAVGVASLGAIVITICWSIAVFYELPQAFIIAFI